MNRELRGEKESQTPAASDGAKHARNVELLFGTGLGTRLAKFLGPQQTVEEMTRSGANWLRIVAEHAAELDELLQQGERSASHDPEMKTGKGRARFLTRRLSDRRLWKAA
jgi:hypothetical protein